MYMKFILIFLKTLIAGAVANLFAYGYSMGRRFRKKSSTIQPAFPDCVTRMAVNLDISGFFTCYKCWL